MITKRRPGMLALLRTTPSRRLTVVTAAMTVWLAAIVGGCETRTPDILAQKLADGRTVAQIVTDSGPPTALLVYTSDMCLFCATPLLDWEKLERNGQVRVVLLLAGDIDEADARQLKIERIPVAGHVLRPGGPVPSEYVLQGGRVVARAEGVAAIRRLRLWTKPATSFSEGSHGHTDLN